MDFFDLLIDPITREPLVYDRDNNVLIDTKSNHTYRLENRIPILRVENDAIAAEEGIHHQLHSKFDYLEHYEKDAEIFDYFEKPDKATIHENKRLHEQILKQIPSDVNWILDVGCGNGWVAKSLVGKGKKVISMDISTTNPLRAIKENPHPNHFGLVANAYNLPLIDNSMDGIIASEIMEHVANPKEFILSLYKALKPGGTLIITTPYNEKIEYSLCIHCNKPTPRHAHLHSFNENNIQKLFNNEINYRWKKFNNKYLIKLRLHVLLSFLPLNIYLWIDTIANKLFNKELRLLLVIKK